MISEDRELPQQVVLGRLLFSGDAAPEGWGDSTVEGLAGEEKPKVVTQEGDPWSM
ncbi:hypothetical protein [Streptomyces sp. NPDC020681]|uniref:hypothetical protein n=1 Tax=Streptomyces sp. NPDC020681 TaxID=3365083 RepID=UPI0037B5DC00